MTDDWEHAAPFGPLGRLVDRLVLGRYMRSLLETRNVALKAEAERAAAQGRIGSRDDGVDGDEERQRRSRWRTRTRRSSRPHRGANEKTSPARRRPSGTPR